MFIAYPIDNKYFVINECVAISFLSTCSVIDIRKQNRNTDNFCVHFSVYLKNNNYYSLSINTFHGGMKCGQ